MKTPETSAEIAVHCANAAIVDWSTLLPHPRNPNRHPAEQIALLAKNIRALGWRHPVIVSRLSGYIVAGHARIEAARLLNINAVPVDYQPFANTEEETAYLIADNRIAELAERDNAVLKDLLQELDTGATDMDLTGYTEQALETLMTQFHIDRPDGNAAGASPWDRVGDAADGVMFSFGTVQLRLPTELFEAFSQSVGVDNLEEWLRESIRH
jgi:hypothetical protein